MTLGYAQVSTDAQNLDRQKDLLKKYCYAMPHTAVFHEGDSRAGRRFCQHDLSRHKGMSSGVLILR